ncbi:UNVERIFIED_CONTAM: hypothetical protein GTU68_028097 [Idotea baltica]|nr:hypothetical protein [Idotea baltica]
MFLLHASPDAPEESLVAQANFVHTVAKPIISKEVRVAAVSFSDYANPKLSFGKGTNICALTEALKDLSHDKWATRIEPVLRDAQKKFKKSKKPCKVLFLPIFGSLGSEGANLKAAANLKKGGVKIFILEVTETPIKGVPDMSSQRGDGKPYHWWIPKKIWPTIVSYMGYMPEGQSWRGLGAPVIYFGGELLFFLSLS